jgi:hypothetical protein
VVLRMHEYQPNDKVPPPYYQMLPFKDQRIVELALTIEKRLPGRVHLPYLVKFAGKRWLMINDRTVDADGALLPVKRTYLVPLKAHRLADPDDLIRLEGLL